MAYFQKLCALLLLSSACLYASDGGNSAVRRSIQRGQEILAAATAAHGGKDAITGLQSYRMKATGTNSPRMQTPTVDPPYEAGQLTEEVVVDLKGNRLVVMTQATGAGFVTNNRIVQKGSEGWNFNYFSKTVTPVQNPATNPLFGQYLRRIPALILRNANNAPNTVRYLGEDTFRGRKQHVLTFVQGDGSQVSFEVDAVTNLISKYEIGLPDPLTGPDVSEIVFEDYTTVNGIKTPRRWTNFQAGDESSRRTLEVEYNVAVNDAQFDVSTDGFASVPTPPTREVAANKLADGVYTINNYGGGVYNAMIVEFKDYVVAIEAPLNTDTVDDIVKRVKELVPNKPIRYAAFTHHHNDHMGGIRGYIEAGATIVTTPGNVKLVNEYASAKLNDSLGKSPKAAKVETIANRKRVFTDGDQVLELIDIGPNPHAKEMVVAYLPKQHIVFQGDLFFMPVAGPIGPAQAGTIDLAQKIKDLGLSVDRIAAVHGQVGTMTELAQSVSEAQSGNGTKAAGN